MAVQVCIVAYIDRRSNLAFPELFFRKQPLVSALVTLRSCYHRFGQQITSIYATYHTIDLYQPWKIARVRADITLATGWYNVNDGRFQTAAQASPTDVSDWLLQLGQCVSDVEASTQQTMMTNNHSTIQQSYFQFFSIFKIIFAVHLDEFDRMIKRL